jgi:hypothetical protein
MEKTTEIEVVAKTVSGKSIPIRVRSNETIGQLKEKIKVADQSLSGHDLVIFPFFRNFHENNRILSEREDL